MRGSVPAALLAVLVSLPVAARAQSSFPAGADVVSELKAQDRGDTSGSYELTTRVTDGGTTIEHALKIERDVYGDNHETESIRVLEGDVERARSNSDPSALGPWADAAIRWAIPFAMDFSGEARRNYRPQERKVRELVQGVVPDARVSTRAGTDGRTVADVEIQGQRPANELAEAFVGIRNAIREADIGLARLRLRGRATTPAASEAE
ncbi:MAG TPA: hypothetical protein VM778_09570 [Gemmatimonadota bacterium]|nr:hypothetical protein [Gemmatimonadota bacterium]